MIYSGQYDIFCFTKYEMISVLKFAEGVYHLQRGYHTQSVYHPLPQERISLKNPFRKKRKGFFLVSRMRLELTRVNHTPLKRTRLPIPPPRHLFGAL